MSGNSVHALDIPNIDGSIDCSAATDTQFVPSWGAVEVAEDSFSRYIYQWMYCHDDGRLSWLRTNGDSTFEPDAFFYNHEGMAYGQAPTGYWASDLPGAYVDTQFGDDSAENAVTMGSGEAVFITSGRVYYTVTRMTSGPGSFSWLKLSAQRGRQWPAGYTGTYNSFGCSLSGGGNNYHTLPFQDHFYAPGCQKYWWQWWSTARSAC